MARRNSYRSAAHAARKSGSAERSDLGGVLREGGEAHGEELPRREGRGVGTKRVPGRGAASLDGERGRNGHADPRARPAGVEVGDGRRDEGGVEGARGGVRPERLEASGRPSTSPGGGPATSR